MELLIGVLAFIVLGVCVLALARQAGRSARRGDGDAGGGDGHAWNSDHGGADGGGDGGGD